MEIKFSNSDRYTIILLPDCVIQFIQLTKICNTVRNDLHTILSFTNNDRYVISRCVYTLLILNWQSNASTLLLIIIFIHSRTHHSIYKYYIYMPTTHFIYNHFYSLKVFIFDIIIYCNRCVLVYKFYSAANKFVGCKQRFRRPKYTLYLFNFNRKLMLNHVIITNINLYLMSMMSSPKDTAPV